MLVCPPPIQCHVWPREIVKEVLLIPSASLVETEWPKHPEILLGWLTLLAHLSTEHENGSLRLSSLALAPFLSPRVALPWWLISGAT
jgi:hypothetical protein